MRLHGSPLPRFPGPVKHALALVTAGVALAACAGGEGDAARGQRGRGEPSPERLAGTVLDSSEVLAMPGDLALVGDHLVLLDGQGDSAVRVYRAATGQHLRSFGRMGHGPGEFQSVWSIDPVPGSPGAFWVYDLQLQRMTRVDLLRDFGQGRGYGRRIVTLRGSGPATSPVWIGDSLLVSPGYFSEPARLAHFDAGGRMLRVVGEPPPGDPGVPVAVRQHAYRSKALPNPGRSLLAVATRHADRLEVHRPDGTVAARAGRPLEFEPVYQTAMRGGEPAMASGEDLRFGYIDLATTSRHIYALYSGLRRADAPGRASFGRTVRVFDWNARLVRVIELDGPYFSIAVDAADRRLYATRIDPSPAVVVLDLASRLPGARASRD